MSTSLQGSSVSGLSEHDLRRLVLKLRWVGLDEEAAELEERLKQAHSDRVLIGPVDTD